MIWQVPDVLFKLRVSTNYSTDLSSTMMISLPAVNILTVIFNTCWLCDSKCPYIEEVSVRDYGSKTPDWTSSLHCTTTLHSNFITLLYLPVLVTTSVHS